MFGSKPVDFEEQIAELNASAARACGIPVAEVLQERVGNPVGGAAACGVSLA